MKKRLIPFILAAALLCGCGTASSGGNVSDASSKSSSAASWVSSEKEIEASSEQKSSAAKSAASTASTASAASSKAADEKKPKAQSHAESKAESAESAASSEAADEEEPEAQSEAESTAESEIIDKLKSDEDANHLPDTDDVIAANEDPFTGSYTESVSGRGVITISKAGENNYTVNVLWSKSAFETESWSMSGEFNGRGVLNYTDGRKVLTTFTTDGEYSEEVVIYSDGTGYFQMGNLDDGSGSVTVNWSDDKENIAEECVFIKQ